ncbi:glycoside hydrolase family 43 protein [Duganella sp. PWIR1]
MFSPKRRILTLSALAGVASVLTSAPSVSAASGDAAYDAYLMVYFTDEWLEDGERIYFATSKDGLHWEDVNGGRPVLTSNLGDKGVRDPSIIRSPSGDKFYILATDLRIASGKGWDAAKTHGSKSIIIWESPDLVNWSAARIVDLASSIPRTGYVWAPEAIYDDSTQDYFVYWTNKSLLNGIEKARIYYSRTKDFRSFTPPAVYIDRPGKEGIIDTQIIRVDDSTSAFKYVRVSGDGTFEGSDRLLGVWQRIGDLSHTGLSGVEGPILYKFNQSHQWGLLMDQYRDKKGYLPLLSQDPSRAGTFSPVPADRYALGKVKKRHGSVLNITSAELRAVQKVREME